MARWIWFGGAAILHAAAAQAAPAIMAYDASEDAAGVLRPDVRVVRILGADAISVAADGTVSGSVPRAEAQLAARYGISVLAVGSNYGAHGFNGQIAHAVLTDPAVQSKAVAGLLASASGFAGLNLDFEAVPHADRESYTAFASRLAAALHANHQVLALSVPAKQVDDPKDSWTGAYDYKALGGIADIVQVMTYDENGPWGPPGPVAGLDWVSACLTYAQSVVPAAGISLGIPAYGYDWDLTSGKGGTVAYADVPALLARTGATVKWDRPTSSPWFSYAGANGDAHTVWFENARSIGLKAGVASRAGIGSVSVWALGLDDPGFWRALVHGFDR